MFCRVGMSTLCLAVLCVVPATSTGARDAVGETALLLDTLDLILQTAEHAQQQQQQQQIIEAMQHCQPHGFSDHAVDISHEQASTSSHPAENAASNTDLANPVPQPDGLTASSGEVCKAAHAVPSALAEALLWGLNALLASASRQQGLPTQSIKLMTDYVVDRFVLFSCDWPLEIAEVAVQVGVCSLFVSIF